MHHWTVAWIWNRSVGCYLGIHIKIGSLCENSIPVLDEISLEHRQECCLIQIVITFFPNEPSKLTWNFQIFKFLCKNPFFQSKIFRFSVVYFYSEIVFSIFSLNILLSFYRKKNFCLQSNSSSIVLNKSDDRLRVQYVFFNFYFFSTFSN